MNLNFDATTVEPSAEYELLPNGEYTAMIKEAIIKETKAGTGNYLSLQLEILDGQYAGRVVFDIINYKNPNPVAQDIGQKTLSSLCRAINVMTINVPEGVYVVPELCNIPMTIKLGVQKSEGYDDRNNVKSYKATGGSTARVAPSEKLDASAPWNS